MPRPPGTPSRIDPTALPRSLKTRLDAAIALAEKDATEVPKHLRTEVFVLRRRLQRERPKGEWGCALWILLIFGLTGLGATIMEGFVGATILISLFAFVNKSIHRFGFLDRSNWRKFSPELLREAGIVAGFGDVERVALDVALAPRADAEVLAEIGRLLEEDARLRAALDEIEIVDPKPIEADRLRLRLALAKETDEDTRRALEASLALCEQRYTLSLRSTAVKGRIRAHRELILQTMQASRDSLTQADFGTLQLTSVRDRVNSLSNDVAAIEAAVVEMRAL